MRTTPQTRNTEPIADRRGQVETVAERRVLALELRRLAGRIARQLGVDVHTAHADVGADLAALRETAIAEATELRALELERLDDRGAVAAHPRRQRGSGERRGLGV